MMDVEESLRGTVTRMLMYSAYSFNVLVAMEYIADTSIETMGVCVKNGRISLRYNPEFYLSLDEGERTFVLMHEVMHVLLHHCTHRSSGSMCRAYKENVAMDLAINSMIPEDIGVTIPRFKKDTGSAKKGEVSCLLPSMFGFKPGLSFEQYLDLLDSKYPDVTIKFVQRKSKDDSSSENSKKGKGMASKKKGGETEEGNGASSITIEVEISEDCALGKITRHRMDPDHGKGYDEDAFIDDYIRNVVEQVERNHGWGHLSNGAIEMVKKAQEQALNWGDILRLKIGPFLSYQKQLSRRRWNKHYGKPFLGSTTKSVEPVAVYADTSGSVGTADLGRFIVEVERIANYTGVYLWSFDTQVHDPDEYVLFNRRSIDSVEFKGRGGTSFSPIFAHAKEKHISQVVVLTDGCAEQIERSQIEDMEVIWVITKGGQKEGKPGTVIEMT